ncbi:MAG: hypothetical protein WD512_19620 [Candidatus Paceibacterota bacterium]
MKKYPTLYKRDSKGRVRIWYMEQDGGTYRTISGLDDGKKVTTSPTYAKGKNVGKVNETTDQIQAGLEIESSYTKQKESGYFTNLGEIDNERYSFEPMLAEKFKTFESNVFSQPKLDGIRCIAKKNGLISRTGKPIISVPHIEEALKPIFEKYPNVIFDGELYNHNLRDDFNEILSVVRKAKPEAEDFSKSKRLVQYHIYDCILETDTTFEKRSKFIKETIHDVDDCLIIVRTTPIQTKDELDSEYAELLESGYEGQMIRKNALYENKRTKSLQKRKEFIDEEFEIVEILEGQGNWAGYGKRVICKLSNEETFGAGIKGNQDHTKYLLNNAKLYAGGKCTIRYQNLTPDGVPRFPIAVAFFETERDL